MDTMINVWAVVEHVRVASGAAELAIFTALLYWFFTSSRVADMLELVGERVGGWCGRDSTGTTLRQAVRTKRRHQQDVYSRLDAEKTVRTNSLYRVKETATVPAPQPPHRADDAGLACPRCAPQSRESWKDPKGVTDNGEVINILDIGRQTYANGGVVSRYLCDLAQCCNLTKYDYKDVVPEVLKDEHFQQVLEDTTKQELKNSGGVGDEALYATIRRRVEEKARKVLRDISSAMSNRVLGLVAWLCHKAVRRVARGGCGTRAASIARLQRARAAGLPLVFVPLHRSHFDYILVTFTLYLTGLRPPLVAAGDNMRIPFFGWFLRGCGAFYIRRKVDGSDYHGDPVYKTALRSYILHSLAGKNNLEFFIEGGRTRTGKPQPPKAGILSVIVDAYLAGAIDDALLVPATVNYERLVDGDFVREQLGRRKQPETFWSALRGIWATLNTDHGAIRVDFNQPLSLKELVTSFQNYKYLKAPEESVLSPLNNNQLAVNLDRQILYNHSHSSLYGDDVTTEHKMTVEAIGRHLVYDAAQATALMSTNVVAYVLLAERRAGCSLQQLVAAVGARAAALVAQRRQLARAADAAAMTHHALDMLGRGLVRRAGGSVRPVLSVPAALELSYYASAVGAHYAAPAIVATALESILRSPNADPHTVSHSELIQESLQLCSVLSQEYILSPPCQRTEELLQETLRTLRDADVITPLQSSMGLEEERWSRRFAAALEEEEGEGRREAQDLKYRVNNTPEALAERRRLLLTIRPLLESYSALCGRLRGERGLRAEGGAAPRALEAAALADLSDQFAANKMPYGEAVSTDAIRNCLRLLKHWGVIEIESAGRERRVLLAAPPAADLIDIIYKFNMKTPLLDDC